MSPRADGPGGGSDLVTCPVKDAMMRLNPSKRVQGRLDAAAELEGEVPQLPVVLGRERALLGHLLELAQPQLLDLATGRRPLDGLLVVGDGAAGPTTDGEAQEDADERGAVTAGSVQADDGDGLDLGCHL